MTQYILKRLLIMIPTFVGIVLISFLVLKLAPGDPAAAKMGGLNQANSGMTAEKSTDAAIKKFRARFHLDDPLPVQFGYFLKRLFTLDLIFLARNVPIWGELWDAMKITMCLNLVVFVLIYVIAIPSGIHSAAMPGSRSDRLTTLFLFILYSLPSFWVAEMLRIRFSGILPIFGLHSDGADRLPSWDWFKDLAWHCILPIICMTYGGFAYISRQMRAGMLEVIRQDYIRTAEAKGAGKWRVVFVHALRNSLFPIITLFASLLPALIGGSVIIEYIFQIPGMGWLTVKYVEAREYDFVMATLMMSAFLTLIGILIADVMYVLVNPQVSFEGRK